MNKIYLKKAMLYGIGVFVGKLAFAGCYPIALAYFTAVYIETLSRKTILFLSIVGLALWLPMDSFVKYTMSMLTVCIIAQLVETIRWKHNRWLISLLAGVSVGLISFGGKQLQVKLPGYWMIDVIEGIFVFALSMILSQVISCYLEPRKVESKQIESNEKLKNYASSFDGLAKVFSGMEQYRKSFTIREENEIYEELSEKVCISCSNCAICQEKSTYSIKDILNTILIKVNESGWVEEEKVKELQKHCPNSTVLLEEAISIFERAKLNLSWYNRLLEHREAIAGQLNAMAAILEDCALVGTDITDQEKRIVEKMIHRLRQRGVFGTHLSIRKKENEQMEIQVTLRTKWGNCVATKDVAKDISGLFYKNMIPHKDSKNFIGKESAIIVFVEKPKFHVLQGVARLTKSGEDVSGDSFSFLPIEHNQFVISLSDGMGSGKRACTESETVIELIEKFLEAGFPKEMAMRMINSAMVLQDGVSSYSTVDMGVIDLHQGMCDFYKIGASSTFIKHDNEVVSIKSSNLPVGLFHQLEIEHTVKKMYNDDYIIMISDGVLEHIPVEDPETELKEIIRNIPCGNPTQLAKKILERVIFYTGGSVPDDMTILVCGIWEK